MKTLHQSNIESIMKRKIRGIVRFWVLVFFVLSIRPDTARAENGSALLGEPQANKQASVESYPIEITGNATTNLSLDWTYCADTPQVVTIFDQKGYLNVAYVDGEQLKIQRYQADMQLVDAISIPKRYPLFGNVICDDAGNYYVVWGQVDEESIKCVTLCVSKYNYQGSLLAESSYKGNETWDNYWGTQVPFRAGNCSMAINRGVLAVNYGRNMYNGHQSNYILYIDCTTMNKLSGENAYCSHSFDQRIVATADGGFLALNHGDAYYRSFGITKIDAQREHEGTLWNFHFREGANRDHGYNETYAQLGSIVETPNAYVFCGSSEKTLSLDVAPTNQYYIGHSESRNLFIQILKKNFWEYEGKEQYKVAGESRIPVGKKPDSANTELFLQGTERDEGVLWLTNYSNEYYVANPKIVGLPEGRFAVLWEKRAYGNPEQVDSYYAVMDENGAVVVEPLIMLDVRLAGNIDPVFRNGRIYWTTKDVNGSYIHSLDPFAAPKDWIKATRIILPEKIYLAKGRSVNLNATIYPANASSKKLTYESSNDYVSVDDDGTVTMNYSNLEVYGYADAEIKVSAENNTVTATCKVICVDFEAYQTQITTGEQKEMSVDWKVSDQNYTPKFEVAVSDESILSAVPGADYKSIKLEGKKKGEVTVTIKVAVPEMTKTVTVNVTNPLICVGFLAPTDHGSQTWYRWQNLNEEIGEFPKVTREGYTLDGWYTQETGGTKVTEKTILKDENSMFYARWIKNGAGQEGTTENNPDNKPGSSQGNTSGLTPENNYDNEKDYRFTIPVAQAGTKVAAYQGCNFYEDGSGNKRCYKDNGVPVINEFKCDGTYTYYFQMDGTCMKSRLTYHPDGEHVIYLDENGHEVFSNFANVKQTISGQAVDDFCFFDVHGYLYVDVVTFDQTGTKLYYANQYGVMERGKWFEFSDTCKWADGNPFDKAGGKYGYAMEDGTLMTNTATYDWEGRLCYMQGNGVAKY